MITKEYRICVPLTVQEYERGLLYMIAKASKEESTSGVPMRIVANEKFNNDLGKGFFTHRVINISDRLPDFLKKLFIRKGENTLQIEEKSWNASTIFGNEKGVIKTVYTCPLFSTEKFEVVVYSMHQQDDGSTVNSHDISPLELKQRIVDYIDIVNDPPDKRYYRKTEDPRFFHSQKTSHGALRGNWKANAKTLMCSYKLVSVNFSYWGLQSKVEAMLQDVIRSIYLTTHRQIYVWLDEWINLSMKDLLKLDEEVYKPLSDKTSSEQNVLPKSFVKKLIRAKL